jgi:hypothetical protein
MRTVTYESVLNGVLKRLSIAPDKAQLEHVLQIAEFIGERLKEAWNYYRWPEVLLIEQRRFRAEWSAQSYTSGAEVYHLGTDEYWKASADAIGTDVPAVSTKWVRLLDLRRTVAFSQVGKAEFDACLAVWNNDPLSVSGAEVVPFNLSASGIEFGAQPITGAWMELRKVAPDFSWSEIWSAKGFSTGAIVYKSPEVYVAHEAATSSDIPGASVKWLKLDFPARLARAVKLGAVADRLGAVGQEDKERIKGPSFDEALDEEVFQITKLQGQTGRPSERAL